MVEILKVFKNLEGTKILRIKEMHLSPILANLFITRENLGLLIM
jgi:hypothetical protein